MASLYCTSVRTVMFCLSFVLNLGANMYMDTWLRGCIFLTLVAGLTLRDTQSITEKLLRPKLVPPHKALLGACAALCMLCLAMASGRVTQTTARWIGVAVGCCLFNSLMVDRIVLEDGFGGMVGGGSLPRGLPGNGGGRRFNRASQGSPRTRPGRRARGREAGADGGAGSLTLDERWLVPGVALCGFAALVAAMYYLHLYSMVTVLEEYTSSAVKKMVAASLSS